MRPGLRGRTWWAGAGVIGLAASACQLVGGFEEFQRGDPAGGAGAGQGGGGGAGAGGAPGTGGTGADGGGAGAAGGAGDGGAAGSGGLPDCPALPEISKTRGPLMVPARRPDKTCFWIDQTEVTEEQYDAFVASGEKPSSTTCIANTDVAANACPAPDTTNVRGPNQPVTCVDWCDAETFCRWAGKDLCGLDKDINTPLENDWYYACSNGNTTSYPYGQLASASACAGFDNKSHAGGVPVNELLTCSTLDAASPVYHLSGNVAEWVHECTGFNGLDEECRYRGGSFADQGDPLRCDTVSKQGPRGKGLTFIGFRCCVR